MKEASPRISFCTTCMGRLDHLKQTLPQNIKDNADYPNCQFVVVNYGTCERRNKKGEEVGTAETEKWICETFDREIKSGLVKYVSYPSAKHFQMAHAKNMAHLMADGDIVCNVDADQWLGRDKKGRGFGRLLADHFQHAARSGRPIYMRHGNAVAAAPYNQGSSLGKVALRKEDFIKMGGYDEKKFEGWGGEEEEFTARLRNRGIKQKLIKPAYAHGIPHDHNRRVCNMAPENQGASLQKIRDCETPKHKRAAKRVMRWLPGGSTLLQARANRKEQRKTGSAAANPDGFGAGEVYVDFSEQPVQSGFSPEPTAVPVYALEFENVAPRQWSSEQTIFTGPAGTSPSR